MNGSENMNLKEEESQSEPSSTASQHPTDFFPGDAEDERGDIHSSAQEPHPGEEKLELKKKDAQFEAFHKEFEGQKDPEAKLQLAVHFMESSLAQEGGTPHFRNFWEVRKLCLPLFKENISPLVRNQLWNKYSELSKEARRLKDILDEQSAFAVEQIDIAIQALEQDIEHPSEQASKKSFSEEIIFPQALKAKHHLYEDIQQQLNVLNVQASRINALRKELLKTEMRVRQKNKFFQRLSAAGDKVFPRRKELIKTISLQFVEDVNSFIKSYFDGEVTSDASLYALREEIKALQSLAKVLTLNTNAFTQTRLKLSECWDHIKNKEKERKKERSQQKATFRQNADVLKQQIDAFKENFVQGLSVDEASRKIDEISNTMRRTELGRDEIKGLRDELGEARKLVQEKIKGEKEEQQRQEQERNKQKREKYKLFKDQIEDLISYPEKYTVEQLHQERDQLLAQIQESSLAKNEKQELERLLKPLRDIITEKKEKALLNLSEDDRQALQQLKEVLRQRKERRQEIKNHLEVLRKAAGSSNLDFEKAMNYTMQMNEEKERLEKINHGIKEVEAKIEELQTKIRG